MKKRENEELRCSAEGCLVGPLPFRWVIVTVDFDDPFGWRRLFWRRGGRFWSWWFCRRLSYECVEVSLDRFGGRVGSHEAPGDMSNSFFMRPDGSTVIRERL